MPGTRLQLAAYTSALFDSAALARIDSDAGVIRGVSVITEGEALGHDAWVDAVTLEQVVSCAGEYANGVRLNNNHGTDLFSCAGFLKDFRIETRAGSRRVIADLHILNTEPNREKLLELAATIPDTFGLSVVISGVHEKRDGRTWLRCDELLSADLVPEPAANPTGLFSRSRKPLSTKTTMEEEQIVEKINEAVAEAVAAAVGGQIEERMAALEKRLEEIAAPEKKPEELEEEKEAELSRVRETAKTVAKEILTSLNIKAGPAVTPPADPGPGKETYEDKVIALQTEGKTKAEAIALATRQHPELHRDYLARQREGKTRTLTLA